MTAPGDELAKAKEQLRLELRADVIAGRGSLPRDRSGRVSSSFLEGSRLELPQEQAPRSPALERNGFSSIAGVIRSLTPAPAAELLELPARDRVAQLEQLERDLAQLLETTAPALWAQLRAPLRRLLNRARRELRAMDRSNPIT